MIAVETYETDPQLSREVHDRAGSLSNLELLPAMSHDALLELLASSIAMVSTSELEGMPNNCGSTPDPFMAQSQSERGGMNWDEFARELPQRRIDAPRAAVAEGLDQESLAGLTFLDIGSGSGLFSLAAAQLGADRVHSFDFDPQSVATTQGLSNYPKTRPAGRSYVPLS